MNKYGQYCHGCKAENPGTAGRCWSCAICCGAAAFQRWAQAARDPKALWLNGCGLRRVGWWKDWVKLGVGPATAHQPGGAVSLSLPHPVGRKWAFGDLSQSSIGFIALVDADASIAHLPIGGLWWVILQCAGNATGWYWSDDVSVCLHYRL
jgi:hypothetical protein